MSHGKWERFTNWADNHLGLTTMAGVYAGIFMAVAGFGIPGNRIVTGAAVIPFVAIGISGIATVFASVLRLASKA